MDQKRAMLYPDIDPAHNAATHDHRISASAAMGLPAEAPPSYDFAIASTSTPIPAPKPAVSTTKGGAVAGVGGSGALGWTLSAPVVTTPEPQAPLSQPQQPRTIQTPSPHDGQTRPVIVVQPLPQQQTQSPTIQVGNMPTRMKLGPNPCAVTCPVCGANKTTRMVFTPNTRTHICAVILCLAGFCCCACLVPYCMNSCRTGNHYCSQCNTFLGVYNPRKV